MRRFLPHLCWLIGLVIVFIGFVAGPGVPYQDPTPAQRALEDRQMWTFEIFAVGGFVLFASGIIWAISRWLIHRFSRKTDT
jgi:hypothetical protein